MITLTEQEKNRYKKLDIDYVVDFGKNYIAIKGYEEEDENRCYIVLDVMPESDTTDSIVIRRLYNTKLESYFSYKGYYFYDWQFQKVL